MVAYLSLDQACLLIMRCFFTGNSFLVDDLPSRLKIPYQLVSLALIHLVAKDLIAVTCAPNSLVRLTERGRLVVDSTMICLDKSG